MLLFPLVAGLGIFFLYPYCYYLLFFLSAVGSIFLFCVLESYALLRIGLFVVIGKCKLCFKMEQTKKEGGEIDCYCL